MEQRTQKNSVISLKLKGEPRPIIKNESGSVVAIRRGHVKTTSRECSNCKVTESALWRRGPNQATLCNACGLYYYHHGRNRHIK